MIHQYKMANYKPMIGNKSPPQVEFLRRRFDDVIKKAKVERDNRILVQKIESIFENGHHHSIKKEIQRHADKFTTITISSPSRKRDIYFINKEN
jgi:hypothetical protein